MIILTTMILRIYIILRENVLYLFEFMQDRLIIGKFCQIASGVRFIMNGANHAMDGISTYPFKAFGGA